MSAAGKPGSPPAWLVGGLIAIAILLIGLFVWGQTLRGPTADIKDKEVRAGMYDFRKAAQEGKLGQRQ